MGGGIFFMKKSLYVFIGIILSFLFINVQPTQANIFDNIILRTTTNTPVPPTPTPTPQLLKFDPNLIKKITLPIGAKSTVTPTAMLGAKDTVTPTLNASETAVPNETSKATDAGNAVTTPPTASNAANAPAGVQTKDIVTYILIGAILLVLLVQGFMPKKGAKPEPKNEEPKSSE
jgi:hypothetical protein